MDDPYVYPGTDCLKNKLNIRDSAQLGELEARLVAVREVQAARSFVAGAYNLQHLQRFHELLFGDVYGWAGRLRTVDISKEADIRFCRWVFIEEQVSALLAKLKREDQLIGRNLPTFVGRLAYYYGELNAFHPFREGNGRTIRAFLRQLSAAAGFLLDWSEVGLLDWSEVGRDANIAACRDNMIKGSSHQLVQLLEPAVRKL